MKVSSCPRREAEWTDKPEQPESASDAAMHGSTMLKCFYNMQNYVKLTEMTRVSSNVNNSLQRPQDVLDTAHSPGEPRYYEWAHKYVYHFGH